MTSPVIHLDELGEMLGLAEASRRATIRRLQEQHGFPHALPGLPSRFSRHLVELWFRTSGTAVAPPPAANDAPADPVAEHRAHLERRLGVAR